jgi:hypothetical protein
MSHREVLLKRIAEVLEKELNGLKLAEYEEEWRETLEQRLLQEGC